MSDDEKCWVCGDDRKDRGGLLFVENFISKVEGYERQDVCSQCQHQAEVYYQEWRSGLQEALRYRVRRAENTKKSKLSRLIGRVVSQR